MGSRSNTSMLAIRGACQSIVGRIGQPRCPSRSRWGYASGPQSTHRGTCTVGDNWSMCLWPEADAPDPTQSFMCEGADPESGGVLRCCLGSDAPISAVGLILETSRKPTLLVEQPSIGSFNSRFGTSCRTRRCLQPVSGQSHACPLADRTRTFDGMGRN